MAGASRQSGKKPHQIRWEKQDWQRLVRAARIRADQTRLAATPTDIIRIGALRYAEQLEAEKVS